MFKNDDSVINIVYYFFNFKYMQTVKERVIQVLCEDEESRNCDQQLFISFIRKFHTDLLGFPFRKSIKLDKLKLVTNYEYICRMRRKIQNEDKMYLPDQKVVKQRRIIK